MAKLNPALTLILGLFAGALLGRMRYCSADPPAEDTRVKIDTLLRVDTLRIISPAPRSDTLLRLITLRLPVNAPPADTAATSSAPPDSASVTLPITQAVYSDSTTYTAWVSGFNPRLDSLHVHSPTRLITQTIHPKPRPAAPCWGISVGAGLAATPRAGLQPALFVGVTYTFHHF